MRKTYGAWGGEILIGTSLSTEIPESCAVKEHCEDRTQRTWKSIRTRVNQSVAFQGTGQSPTVSQPGLWVSSVKHSNTPGLPSHSQTCQAVHISGSLSTYFFCQNCSFLLSWLINPSQFPNLSVSVKSPERTCPLEIITTLPPPEPPVTFQLHYKTNDLYFKEANWWSVFLEDKLWFEQGVKDQNQTDL